MYSISVYICKSSLFPIFFYILIYFHTKKGENNTTNIYSDDAPKFDPTFGLDPAGFSAIEDDGDIPF